MKGKTCFDSGVPNAPVSSVLRYLEKILRVKFPTGCSDFQSAMRSLGRYDGVYVPEGLNEDCALMVERFNVISSVWNLNKKSALAGVAYEMGDEGYMLCVDSNLHGAESLFLITSCVCENSWQLDADLESIVHSWAAQGSPRFVTGGFVDDDGTHLHIVAAQLTTLISKQNEQG